MLMVSGVVVSGRGPVVSGFLARHAGDKQTPCLARQRACVRKPLVFVVVFVSGAAFQAPFGVA